MQFRSIGAVVHQHDHQRQILAHHGFQLAHGHQEAAIADHQNRWCLRPGARHPERGAKAKTDGREIIGHLEIVGARHREIRHHAQEISGVIDHAAFLGKQSVQRHRQRSRIDRARGIGGLEVLGDREGLQEILGLRAVERFVGGAFLGYRGDKLLGHQLGVADHRDVGGGPASDIGAYRVDLDQRRVGERFAETHGQNVQPRAHRQHAIGLSGHAPRGGMREGTDDAEIVRVIPEHVLALGGGRQQGAGFLGKRDQRVPGAGFVGTVPGQDQRPLGGVEKTGRGGNGMSACRFTGPPGDRLGVDRFWARVIGGNIDLGGLDVHRQQQHHPGSATGRGRRVGEGLARAFGSGRPECPDAGGFQHALGVDALVVRALSVQSAAGDRHIALDDQHRIAGPAGEPSPVQPISHGGSTANTDNRQPPGRGGIAIGHGDRGVLMPGADEIHAGGIEGNTEMRGVVAHQPKDRVNPHRLNVLGEDLIDMGTPRRRAVMLFLNRHGESLLYHRRRRSLGPPACPCRGWEPPYPACDGAAFPKAAASLDFSFNLGGARGCTRHPVMKRSCSWRDQPDSSRSKPCPSISG